MVLELHLMAARCSSVIAIFYFYSQEVLTPYLSLML